MGGFLAVGTKQRFQGDGWSVVEVHPDHAFSAQSASVFTLGNGFLGLRGATPYDERASLQCLYLNGVYETVPILYHERFPGFATTSNTRPALADPLQMRIRVDGELCSLSTGTTLAYERRLGLKSGTLSLSMRWRSSQGKTVDITSERLVSLVRPSILAARTTVTAIDFDGEIELLSALDGPVLLEMHGNAAEVQETNDPRVAPAFAERPWRHEATTSENGTRGFIHRTRVSGFSVATAATHRGDARFEPNHEHNSLERLRFLARLAVKRGAPIRVDKFVAITASQTDHLHDLLAEAVATTAHAARDGFDVLAEEQRQVLDHFWSQAEVAIAADPNLERALRFNMFQLFQAAGRNGKTSIAAKGQSGEGYEGHYFWDAEVFCLPMFAFTAPQVARRLLEFRWRTLPQARAIARRLGHARGALFPWRTIAGDECSAYFLAGTAQYHINAGIAYAVRQYWEATGDDAFLVQTGAELVIETARIWLEVGFFNPRCNDQFAIPGVTGPDEYTVLVDNNFYTNAMAKAHLQFAGEVVAQLRKSPDVWLELSTRLEIHETEIELWASAADRMYLPYDATLGIYKQDDSFLDKKPWEFGHSGRPLLLHHHPLVLYRHQVCKQADSVLAMFLVGGAIGHLDRKRTFEYYEKITVHDSTLSTGIFSIVASEIGALTKAVGYARTTTLMDLDDLHGNTGHGLHMAAMGASWMAWIQGFAGLRLANGRVCFRPLLPPGVSAYAFRLVIRDRLLSVRVDHRGTTYELLKGAPFTFCHGDLELLLDEGATQLVPPNAGEPELAASSA